MFSNSPSMSRSSSIICLLLGQVTNMLSLWAVLVSVLLLGLILAWLRVESQGEQEGRGRAVLATGRDSGFGHRVALCLDLRGFVIFAGCLNPEGHGPQNLVQSASQNLKFLKMDVTTEDDVRQAKTKVLENLPERGLWAVVNNAGISDWAEIEWSTTQDFYHMLDVNLLGSIRTSITFLPMVRAVQGWMVFVSSIFSFHCLNMAAYSISKRGLEAFADCLRVEMEGFGLKVSIIQPGNFGPATSILKEKRAEEIWMKLDGERRRRFNWRYLELEVQYFSSTSRLFPPVSAPLADAVFRLSIMDETRKQLLYAC